MQTLADFRHSTDAHYGRFVLLPVETINNTTYAIERRTTTPDGYERLDGYDITGFDDIEHETSRSARFDTNGQPDENGTHVIVFWPDEGHTSAVTKDGRCSRWITSWAVALSTDPRLQEHVMDDIAAHVDAGGHLEL
jgi:hypothetical protein